MVDGRYRSDFLAIAVDNDLVTGVIKLTKPEIPRILDFQSIARTIVRRDHFGKPPAFITQAGASLESEISTLRINESGVEARAVS